jgi:hypothetical protein
MVVVAEVAGGRMTAQSDGDFVVFLIGARLDSKLELARSLIDLGGRRGMRHMLDYLAACPEKGLLAYFGNLARDLPGEGGPIRGHVRQHAPGTGWAKLVAWCRWGRLRQRARLEVL